MKNAAISILIFALWWSLAACTGTENNVPAGAELPTEPTATMTAAAVEATPAPIEPTATTPADVPTATPPDVVVTEAAAGEVEESAPGEPEVITMPGANNLDMVGTFYPGAGSGPWPGVILLHMLGSNRQAWEGTGLPQTLAEAGYALLAVDMRGHGETGGAQDWELAAEDLQLVWAFLTGREDIDPARTAVMGASIGANMALITGANIPQVQTVVLLSPGLDYRGVTTEEAMSEFGDRPVLIIASEEDRYAADSSCMLADLAAGDSQLQLYNGAGHGTAMFGPEPG